jgi:putative transcriptional regulator
VSSINLTHHFLIAMPSMADPYFARTLTYVCEHNDQGALGLVVNRPIDMTLQALFERLSLKLKDKDLSDAPIYFGGPVQTDRGFVLHEPAGNWQSTLRVRDAIGLTTSKDILEAVGRGEGPQKILVTLGYAGWSAGQLEHELAQNGRHHFRPAVGGAPAGGDGAARRGLRAPGGLGGTCLSRRAPSSLSTSASSALALQ